MQSSSETRSPLNSCGSTNHLCCLVFAVVGRLRCVLVSDANPMVGPGLRGCKNRPTDFGCLRRVNFVPSDGSVRDSATGHLAGGAKALFECANW